MGLCPCFDLRIYPCILKWLPQRSFPFFSFCHYLQLAHCWSMYPDGAMKRSVARPAIGTFGKNTYIVWCQVILIWFVSSSFGRKGKRFGRIFGLAHILVRTGYVSPCQVACRHKFQKLWGLHLFLYYIDVPYTYIIYHHIIIHISYILSSSRKDQDSLNIRN